jgi:hypothetical protein
MSSMVQSWQICVCAVSAYLFGACRWLLGGSWPQPMSSLVWTDTCYPSSE